MMNSRPVAYKASKQTSSKHSSDFFIQTLTLWCTDRRRFDEQIKAAVVLVVPVSVISLRLGFVLACHISYKYKAGHEQNRTICH